PLAAGRRNARGAPATSTALDTLPPADSVRTWVDWEVAAGAEKDEALWVVRAEVPSGVGLVLTGLLLLWVWGARRFPARPGWKEAAGARPEGAGRRALARLLAWVGGAGLAYFWLPAGLSDAAWW